MSKLPGLSSDCWWFRNPAPAPLEVSSWNPIIYGWFYTSQVVVWDFFHQQYGCYSWQFIKFPLQDPFGAKKNTSIISANPYLNIWRSNCSYISPTWSSKPSSEWIPTFNQLLAHIIFLHNSPKSIHIRKELKRPLKKPLQTLFQPGRSIWFLDDLQGCGIHRLHMLWWFSESVITVKLPDLVN